MTAIPDLYLGQQLSKDGTYREIFTGPGDLIAQNFAHGKGLREKQLSFFVAALAKLSKSVKASQRVEKRAH